jgi:3-methyladenine DNA glycosylase Tag
VVRVALADVAAVPSASLVLAKDLCAVGFRFTGPVTVQATMQACGVVSESLA